MLLPLSFVVALFLVSQGVVQTLAPNLEVRTVEGARQVIALGPVASQEAIKMLGTNGGGFFNANSAHPFENPTPLVNLVQMLLIFLIPAGLTFTYGRMARDGRQGWALFAAMAVLFLGGVAIAYGAESGHNPALAGLGVDQSAGNLEGKETRFGVANSALFATVTTDASCGAVNSMHDSFTPIGGLVPMVNMQLGEVVFGGVGAGLYGMLVMAILTVFLAGLMVGRTPEYLGKKVEGREMKLAVLYILVFPVAVLVLSGWAAVVPYGTSSLANAGPHGLSELLYAFTSGAANNGSAFAGLNANTPFWNLALGVDMLLGRFFMIVPALAIAGAMVAKKSAPPGPGTFPTGRPHVRPPPRLGDPHRGRADLLPGALPRAGARALRRPARKGLLAMASRSRKSSLLDPSILRTAALASLAKLDPRLVARNPGDVRGRGGQPPHHAPLAAGPDRPARRRVAGVVHADGEPVALVHGRLRQLRRGGRRGARQGPGRHAAEDAQGRRGPPAVERQRRSTFRPPRSARGTWWWSRPGR